MSVYEEIKHKFPKHALTVHKTISDAGYEIFVVGGCVRDALMDKKIKDLDFATNASVEKIQSLFTHTVYNNDFGTVGVVFEEIEDANLKIVEITPYRKEGKYLDNRKPEEVTFNATLKEDLSRRDFTINALAYDLKTSELIDEFGGVSDIHLGKIRTVGDPKKRFDEDALRLMRAVRIATQLNGEICKDTLKAISECADLITNISIERVRDEFIKIIKTNNPVMGIRLLIYSGLMKYIVPELLAGDRVEQNQAHKYDVLEHNLRTLEHSGVKDLGVSLRLASLFHDISKPETREWSKEKEDWTFYSHEVVGARVAKKILTRLKFPKDVIDEVTLLVRWHMFFSDVEKVTLSGVRRMVARVGKESIWDLIDLRMCDRIGTGRPKEQPYRLRKYVSLVEEVLREPITPGKLSISGDDLINEVKMKPGIKMGNTLHALLAEVLDDPDKNNSEYLLKRATELNKMPDDDLVKLGKSGKLKVDEEEKKEIDDIRKKYGVS